MRVVTLTCSNTEIVCALGCGHMLVGADDHSDRPEEILEGLPRVGRDLQIDPQRVRDLKPDLVLGSLTVPGHEKVIRDLALTRDLNLLVLSPLSLSDVLRDIRQVAGILGVPERGEALVREFEESTRSARARAEARSRRPRVLVEWWPRPCIAAGRQSWIQDLLEICGAENVLDEDCPSRPLETAEACALNPELLILSWCGVPPQNCKPSLALKREGWGGIQAIQNQQVISIPEAWLGRPGPGLLEGLRRVEQALDDLSH